MEADVCFPDQGGIEGIGILGKCFEAGQSAGESDYRFR